MLSLQQEIQRSEESRYDHRLHGVLLVAQGMTCPEVARLLGDAPRTVEYWVHRFQQQGLAGLTEAERSGRPPRLSAAQVKEVARLLRGKPSDAGMGVHLWDGPVPVGVDRKKLWRAIAGTAMPTCVPATGFPPPQTTSGLGAGRSCTAEGA